MRFFEDDEIVMGEAAQVRPRSYGAASPPPAPAIRGGYPPAPAYGGYPSAAPSYSSDAELAAAQAAAAAQAQAAAEAAMAAENARAQAAYEQAAREQAQGAPQMPGPSSIPAQAYGSDGTPYTGTPGAPQMPGRRRAPRRGWLPGGGFVGPRFPRGAYNEDPRRPPASMGDEIRMGVPRIGGDTDDYEPRVFDEHDDDGRGLDNEIDDSPRMGFDLMDEYELANESEIVGCLMGQVEQEAILHTLARARDNRRPCPPMVAVDLDAPLPAEQDLIGATASPEAFPITAQLIEAYKAAGKPRIVRIDTEESYEAFRDSGSPERLEMLARVAKLEGALFDHLTDADAHNPDVAEELEEAQGLAAAEEAKRIPLRMPKRFDGLIEAWHQGDMAAASMLLPRPDGGRWVATVSAPLKQGELEAAKAAAEAGVPAAAIVGYLPAIGATLAAANALKPLAAGADDKPGTILRRREAGGTQPFMVRLEPQVSPAIFALGELLCLCQAGNARACDEWNRLAAQAPGPVKQAMGEIQAAMKPQATTVGGAVGDFFGGLWQKIAGFFAGEAAQPVAKPVQPARPQPVQAQAQAVRAQLPRGVVAARKALPQRASA